MIYVPVDMLPAGGVQPVAQQPPAFVGQILLIAPVTGVGASDVRALGGALGVPRTAQIWGQTFHEALFKALTDSRLFASVARDGAARFALHADILEQATAGYGARITVHYTLTDQQSGHDLLRRDITASHDFPLTPATFVAPYNTQLLALMRACGSNIGSLLAMLAGLPRDAPPAPAATGG